MDENIIKVTIDDKSIRKEINENIKTPFDAFNEYLWNAIDAGAKNLQINFVKEKEGIKEISIQDDGVGIDYYDLKDKLFGKFNVSQKLNNKKSYLSLPRGENGYGRFSFFKFASKIKWITVFEKDNIKQEYEIEMESSNLTDSPFSQLKETQKDTGTKVIFTFEKLNLNDTCSALLCDDKKDKLKVLKENIILDLAWPIELYDLNITINGKKINYDNIIEEKDEKLKEEIDGYKFEIKFIKWKESLKNQSSRYYLLNSNNEEVYMNTTTLNNKGDEFYHSIYVTSNYFNEFDIFTSRTESIYKSLIEKINKILEIKKKPYLDIFVNKKFEKLKGEEIFPKFSTFEEKFKRPLYEKALKDVIALEPRLFSNQTNNSQKKVFLELINKLLDDEKSRNNLYDILIVLVDDDNRKYLDELKHQLENYGLENILGTIKEIENRIKTIKSLKKIFNEDFKKYSELDIQKLIEKNYWLFGEEYNLMIGSEEDDFNKLRKVYCEKFYSEEKINSNNKFSKRQVDLFICADTEEGRRRKHLIVEIKKPELYLKKENYRQIEDYKDEISKIPEFNSTDRHSWNYILLYRDISKEHLNHFRDKIKDKFTGETVDSTEFFKIFVIKWSDLLEECDYRMKYLKERLELKKENLLEKQKKIEIENSTILVAAQKSKEERN